VEHVIVVGGTGVVPDSVVDEIKAQVSDVQRLGGQDRYETSVKIADALGTSTKPTKAVVASGEGYADALSAGPAAAINGIPILLTTQNTLPDSEANYLEANSDITATYVIGETGSVSDSVKDSLPSPTRLGGADRYETNIAVLKEFKSDFGFGNVYAALGNGPVGNEFADALTGGALAAKNKNPLIITGLSLSSATTDFLDENVPKNSTLTVLGGTGNISDSLADEIKDAFGKASTGGGGGGSSSDDDVPLSGNLENHLIVANDNYKTFVKNLNDPNKEEYNEYFTIKQNEDENDDSINVQLKKTDRSVKEIFEDAQNKYLTDGELSDGDIDKIEQSIGKVNDKLTAVYNKELLGSLTVDNKDLKTFLSGLDSRYIDDSGLLKPQAIIDEIKTKEGKYTDGDNGYASFKEDLTDKITAYFNNHSDQNTGDVTVKFHGYTVSNVYKDSTKLFDYNSSAEDSAQELVNTILPEDGVTGTYTINLANDAGHFIINVDD
jgi:hypothetical protein